MSVNRKVDKLGRIVLPIDIRNSLGIKENDSLHIECDGVSITLRLNKKVCKICESCCDVNAEYMICHKCISLIKSKTFDN